MGRFVDLDNLLSDEDKKYLRSRGRGYLIPANERRFGTSEEPREPEEHEAAGAPSQSQFYDTQERDRAVYDQGGAPLPGAVLDYNTGRAYDRDNGVQLVEPTFGTPQIGQNANPVPAEGGFVSYDEEDSDIDDDIAEEVTSLKVPELKARLKKEGVEFESSDLKDALQDKLAIHLQDKRNGKV